MHIDPFVKRLLSLLLSLTLILPSPVLLAALPGEPGARDAAERLDRIARDYESAFRLIEALLPRIPRDIFDPAVVLEKARSEPTRLFLWVRDNTYLVPYRGLLRGAEGVLMDRLGNSLDRALLLAQLLDLAGQEARLARGKLSDEALSTLIAGRRPVLENGTLAGRRDGGEQDAVALISKLATELGPDAARLAQEAEDWARRSEVLRRQTMHRVAEHTEALMAILGGLPGKAAESGPAQRQAEAYWEHWWVQWKKGDTWVDLDPSLPRAKPGEVLTTVDETLAPVDLQDEIRHRVEIRVIAQTWGQGSVSEQTLLSHVSADSDECRHFRGGLLLYGEECDQCGVVCLRCLFWAGGCNGGSRGSGWCPGHCIDGLQHRCVDLSRCARSLKLVR